MTTTSCSFPRPAMFYDGQSRRILEGNWLRPCQMARHAQFLRMGPETFPRNNKSREKSNTLCPRVQCWKWMALRPCQGCGYLVIYPIWKFCKILWDVRVCGIWHLFTSDLLLFNYNTSNQATNQSKSKISFNSISEANCPWRMIECRERWWCVLDRPWRAIPSGLWGHFWDCQSFLFPGLLYLSVHSVPRLWFQLQKWINK